MGARSFASAQSSDNSAKWKAINGRKKEKARSIDDLALTKAAPKRDDGLVNYFE